MWKLHLKREADVKFQQDCWFVQVIAWGRVKLSINDLYFQKLLKFQQLLKTQVTLTFNFARIRCDYFLKTESKITEFLNAHNYDSRWLSTSFSYSSKFARKFLSFTHFLKTLIHHSVLFFLFSFSVWSFNSLISPSTISMAPLLQKNNFTIE